MGSLPDFRFEEAPELPGADKLTRILVPGIRRTVDLLWDFRIEGVENVPLDGPALLTPNHLSFCDSVFVSAALPRRGWAIGKGEYMDSWKTKHVFPALGMIPIDRAGGAAADVALDTAAKVLKGGHLFLIYPEGTRSRSGNLHKGRTGAARLAHRCNAPIVPVGHEGTVAIQPPDTFLMKPFKTCTVRFGTPMHIEDFGDPDDPRTARYFTDAVMYEISQLSGQTYVDTYAGKSDEPAAAPVAAPTGRPRSAESPTVGVPPNRVARAPKPKVTVPSGRAHTPLSGTARDQRIPNHGAAAAGVNGLQDGVVSTSA